MKDKKTDQPPLEWDDVIEDVNETTPPVPVEPVLRFASSTKLGKLEDLSQASHEENTRALGTDPGLLQGVLQQRLGASSHPRDTSAEERTRILIPSGPEVSGKFAGGVPDLTLDDGGDEATVFDVEVQTFLRTTPVHNSPAFGSASIMDLSFVADDSLPSGAEIPEARSDFLADPSALALHEAGTMMKAVPQVASTGVLAAAPPSRALILAIAVVAGIVAILIVVALIT